MSQDRIQTVFSPSRLPFLYLVTAHLAGVLLDRGLEPPRTILIVFAAACIAATVPLVIAGKDVRATAALLISFACAGALLSLTERTGIDPSRLVSLYESRIISADDPVELTGTLTSPPEPAPGIRYLDLEAERVGVGDSTIAASGRARLMIAVSSEEAQSLFERLALDTGSRIRVLVRLERARQFSNPGSPDFNDSMDRRGYDLKGVIKSMLLIEHIGDSGGNRILAMLYRLRLKLMEAIDARFRPPIAGTLKAMLAGNRYFLDGGAAESLREGSTYHTLVIAGLHIGIIAWALLGGRSGHKRRNTVRVILCLIVLWTYAIMVGLAPPVTRATAMISVGLIGPLFFRLAASINTVSLAAFLMLVLKPALVADPGFQLSFAAVAGIVSLALPLTEKLRTVGNWRPTSRTPHPPSCHWAIRRFAESVFWDDVAFNTEMRRSAVRYRLTKANASRVLGRTGLQPMVRGAAVLMITSAAIQLATLPLTALYFNRVAPVGVLLNVIAGLLTAVLMLAAIGAIVIGWFSVWLSAKIGLIVYAAHYLLVNSVVPFADLPFATFRVAHYEGHHTIIYALYFLPLAMLAVLIDRWHPVDQVKPIEHIQRENRKNAQPRADRNSPNVSNPILPSGVVRSAPVICACGLAAALIAVVMPPISTVRGRLTVHFLDVGQGDSALVVFPRGKTMLVDGGGELRFAGRDQIRDLAVDEQTSEQNLSNSGFSIGEAVVSRFIWSLGRTRVDYVLATHADADHIGGLSDAVRNFDIGQAIVGHAPTYDPEFNHFANEVHKKRLPLSIVSSGERFEIDGVAVEVLWPPLAREAPVTSKNNDSIVLRLTYGSMSILLAGDIEQAAEAGLVMSGLDLRADLLKVPHHGSKTSSTEAFIAAVNPRWAVISVGERSRFGHPHASVVDRYLSHNVRLFQTGRDGMVTVRTDGSTLEIDTYRK